jgi:uncharacterized membrane protein
VTADGLAAGGSEGRPRAGGAVDPAGERLDLAIARLLSVGTYAGVTFLAIGFLMLMAAGGSPLDPHVALDVRGLGSDLLAGRPEAAVWLGLLVLIATPSARVVASLVGYRRARERGMVAVSLAILVVVAVGVIVGVALGQTAG